MNDTVRVGQRPCEHAAFPRRNCIVVSRPFYTAFLPLRCEDALGRRVDLSACIDPSLGTVEAYVRLYTVGETGAWISTVRKRPFDATLPYPNAPPLGPRVHVLPLSYGHAARVAVDCEVYATPLETYRVELLAQNDTTEPSEGGAARAAGEDVANVTRAVEENVATPRRDANASLTTPVAVTEFGVDATVWLGTGGALLTLLGFCGCSRWRRRQRKTPS